MKLMSILTEDKQQDFKRLPLAYKLSALNPIIDTGTMEEHFKKHFKGYTDKFNAACKEFKCTSDKHGLLERAIDICKKHYKKDAIRNNGGGYINHLLYFENMTPDYKAPSVKLKAMIDDAFGSFTEFKEQFKQAGLDQFGSGWVWLCSNNGKLDKQVPNCVPEAKLPTQGFSDKDQMIMYEDEIDSPPEGKPVISLDMYDTGDPPIQNLEQINIVFDKSTGKQTTKSDDWKYLHNRKVRKRRGSYWQAKSINLRGIRGKVRNFANAYTQWMDANTNLGPIGPVVTSGIRKSNDM